MTKTKTQKADKKVEKVVKPTLVSVIKLHLEKGTNNIDDLKLKIKSTLDERKITHNSKGKKIEDANILSLTRAILRDIKKGTGPKKWREFKVIENEKELKIVPNKA